MAKDKTKDKKRFGFGKLVLLGVLVAAAIAVKKALEDSGGSYVPPAGTSH